MSARSRSARGPCVLLSRETDHRCAARVGPPVPRQRRGELAGETPIACICHVQSIGTDHSHGSELLNMIPFPHDLEAAKETNMGAPGRLVDDPLHLAPSGPS